MGETYFGDVLQQFQNGVQMDLRVRLAIEFVKAAPAVFYPNSDGCENVSKALDMADELLSQGEARGWIKPLPEDNELNTSLRRHLERNVRAQAFSQAAGQRMAAEEAPSVAVANGPLANPGRRQ
jgi:hypothetical protein